MNFIRTVEGPEIAEDAIESVSPRRDGNYVLRLKNGSSYTGFRHSLDKAIRSDIITAQPGFFVIEIPDDDWIENEEAIFFKQPVVGWYAVYGEAMPLCLEEPLGSWAVLCPDGSVIEPHNGRWDGIEEFKRVSREQAKKRNQKREEKSSVETK